MDKFVFHYPVKILFGQGVIDSIGNEAAGLGSHALLVFGRQAIKNYGLYKRVSASLRAHGVRLTDCGGVSPNPLLSKAKEGIETARSHGCDMVIGLGGGSVLDTAKAIAAGVAANHDIWKLFTGKKSVSTTLPVITVPTVAGSGSETNNAMVLTHDEKRLKFGFGHRLLFPAVCLADPSVSCTVPADQTAYGAVDALCHCLDPYFSSRASGTQFQLGFLEHLGRTIIATTDRLRVSPDCYDDRATMLWCTSLAMSPLAAAGLGKISFSIHLLEHGLSATTDLAHGAGLAALLPGWLRYHQAELNQQISRFGAQVFDLDNTDEMQKAGTAITALETFLRRNGCPVSVAELGFTSHHIPGLLDHCLQQARVWRMKDYDEHRLKAVLQACLSA
jgi:alcohol dehydrogenase YqhD (iron-dependent ADH family)